MAFKVIIIVIELMFLGINMFLALLRAHFNPHYAWAKMILSRAKNIFMPANVNSIVILMFSIFKSLFISASLNIPSVIAFYAFLGSFYAFCTASTRTKQILSIQYYKTIKHL